MSSSETQTPTAESIGRDLAFAQKAARLAGQRALTILRAGRWQDATLGDMADQACDALLHGMLAAQFPEDGILSEETKDSPERLTKDRTWIIDPLDGTKEYRANHPDWAVHVGLTWKGECLLGAVALPAQDRLLWGIAAPDHAAAGLEGAGDLQSGKSQPPATLRIAISRSHTPPWVETLASQLDAELVRAGSVGNKVAMLLGGEADLYAHKVGLKEWDTCAPECVATALGWHVSRLDGAKQRYNQRDPKNGEVLVCRPGDRERVLAALAQCDLG